MKKTRGQKSGVTVRLTEPKIQIRHKLKDSLEERFSKSCFILFYLPISVDTIASV
jgi:hypothetical protein